MASTLYFRAYGIVWGDWEDWTDEGERIEREKREREQSDVYNEREEHTFTNVRVKRIRQETIQFARHEEEDGVDGLGGEVMFFNTTRSHATVIGQGPTFSTTKQAKLWPTFFWNNTTPTLVLEARALGPAGPPPHLVYCDDKHGHCTSGKHLDECWTLVQGNVFQGIPQLSSLDPNTIPSSYDSTSSL